jgi:hypothetical protein
MVDFKKRLKKKNLPKKIDPLEIYGLLDRRAGSRYFCESLFWASLPKQAAKT